MDRKTVIVIAVIIAAAFASLFFLPKQKRTEQNSGLSEIRLDYANWSPIGLVLRQQGFLEEELKKDNIRVRWVFSQGSNKSMEFLRSAVWTSVRRRALRL